MSSAPGESTAPERTFAFVDLAGFTALTEVHGDDEAVRLLDRFVAFTHDALDDGDELVKCLGDAVMLSFSSPPRGLEAVRRLLQRCQSVGDFPVPRSGLHHGPAIGRNGDWFGATVNLAARVAAQAHGGQTLATTPVATAARSSGITVTSLGSFSLRNIARPTDLYELALVPVVEATSVDPVCRMQVRHDAAAGRLRQGGQDHWFCSLRCARSFLSDPARNDDEP